MEDWGRRYRSNVQQKICYDSLAAVVYYIWKAHNQVFWEGVVMRPDIIIKQIQADMCITVRNRIT